MAGAIETAFGLPSNSDIRTNDRYARRIEQWAWEQMVPQPEEVGAHYYFDLTTNGGTETGLGTVASPYVAFASINVVLAAHLSTDVIELNVRTSPTINYLYLDSANRVTFGATTPEVRWVPWRGQARFSTATTRYTTGWTLVSGTCYKRTVAKPGWVSSDNQGFLYPNQFKYVGSVALCEAETFTWHHDGTDLYVNNGANANPIRVCPVAKDYLIGTAVNCRRVLLSGIHGEGFGLAHGVSGIDSDASCIKMMHGYRNDRVLVANCTDLVGGGHALSVTGVWEGDTGFESTTVWIDCTTGGGYEITKGHGPFNFYSGGGSEAAYIRCRNIAGPAQAPANSPAFAGHSNGSGRIGLWFLSDCENMESTGPRQTGIDGVLGITGSGLLETDAGRRSVVSRYKHFYGRGTGVKIPTGIRTGHTILGMSVDVFGHSAINYNAGGMPTNHGANSGTSLFSRYSFTGTVSGYRVLGDGGSPSEKFINCLFEMRAIPVNGTINFGSGAITATGMRFINCIFANVQHANVDFSATNLTDVYQNCGFYRCTPPSNAINPVIIDNLEPYIASFESQLLSTGQGNSLFGQTYTDANGRIIDTASPPIGHVTNNYNFAWADEGVIAAATTVQSVCPIERSPDDANPITFSFPGPSLTLVGTRSIDNGTYGAVSGAIAYLRTEGGSDLYTLAYNAADRPSAEGVVRYRFVQSGWVSGDPERFVTLRIAVSGGGSATSGDWSITRTFQVSSGAKVPGVRMSLVGVDGKSDTTEADGIAIVKTNNGTYTLRVVVPAGYEDVADSSLTISGADSTATVTLVATTVEAPANPLMSALVVLCLDEEGNAQAAVEVDARMIGIPSGSTNTAFKGNKQTATSDVNGLASFQAPRGAKYQVKRGTAAEWQTITIGAGDVTSITSFIGSP